MTVIALASRPLQKRRRDYLPEHPRLERWSIPIDGTPKLLGRVDLTADWKEPVLLCDIATGGDSGVIYATGELGGADGKGGIVRYTMDLTDVGDSSDRPGASLLTYNSDLSRNDTDPLQRKFINDIFAYNGLVAVLSAPSWPGKTKLEVVQDYSDACGYVWVPGMHSKTSQHYMLWGKHTFCTNN